MSWAPLKTEAFIVGGGRAWDGMIDTGGGKACEARFNSEISVAFFYIHSPQRMG